MESIWIAEEIYRECPPLRYADDFLILMTGNPAVAKKKLDEIMEIIGLTMNTEKTRIVRAEEGFDFLGFWFVR